MGAPALEELNQYDPEIPTAVIYGREYGTDANGVDEDPFFPKQLLWRTLYSGTVADQGPAFSKDEDSEWVNSINSLRAEYEENIQVYDDLINESNNCFYWAAVGGIYSIIGGAYCAFSEVGENNGFEQLIESYERSIEWLDDADEQWKIIIGAKRFNQSITYRCLCFSDEGEEYITSDSFDNPSDCINQNCEAVEVPVITSTLSESDGIVPTWSQVALPGNIDTHRMEKMNHFQARNSSETAKALRRLFGGGLGEFFQTDEK